MGEVIAIVTLHHVWFYDQNDQEWLEWVIRAANIWSQIYNLTSLTCDSKLFILIYNYCDWRGILVNLVYIAEYYVTSYTF